MYKTVDNLTGIKACLASFQAKRKVTHAEFTEYVGYPISCKGYDLFVLIIHIQAGVMFVLISQIKTCFDGWKRPEEGVLKEADEGIVVEVTKEKKLS